MIPLTKFTGRLGNQMFQFAYILNQVKKGDIPDYYIQDEKYFKEVAVSVRQLFSSNISTINAVSIHVRRGDFVTNGFDRKLWETDYYQKAMELFPGENFIVFSDDIEWCKQQEMFKDCTFADGDEIEDMNRMASCKHNIIANSSFSWWAAWLNPNPEKKVVCPKLEYIDGIERRIRPNNWIRI